MYFLYRHIREDKNEPFYIGIGTVQQQFTSFGKQYARAYTKSNRNSFWKNIVNKSEYSVEIIFESANKELIQNKEIEFIKLYGRKDYGNGTLVNHTDGGEHNEGKIVSEKRKEELRSNWTGDKNPNYGKHGDKHPAHGKGGFFGKHTSESLQKISERSSGYNHPGCKLTKEQVIEIQEAWNKIEKITKKDFCKPFEIKFDVKFRVIYNALNYKI